MARLACVDYFERSSVPGGTQVAPRKEAEPAQIIEVGRARVTYLVLGESPLICNRMSAKAKQELLFPKGRKTTAEKASTMKHNPLQEFRASPYTLREDDAPTLIGQVSTAFKKAIMGAALDQPGAKKAQIGRLVYVETDMVPIYGVPELLMSVTRSADMARTPDVRTRAIIPHWACYVDVTFAVPLLRQTDINKLVATAGQTQGIGDWRVEKGSGDYGRFQIVEDDNAEFLEIIARGGRAAQVEAMANPASYDAETEELLSWFTNEADDRGFKVVA